jgi:RNA polymerase sigma factor (sigma-70 family)
VTEPTIEEREEKLIKHLSRIIDNLNEHWHSIQLLLGYVSKPLTVDDRGLANYLRQFAEKMNELSCTIGNFNHEQGKAELMYIGSRLNNIELEIKKIREGGIKKSVDLQIQVDGYEMVKKPLSYDKAEPIQKSDYELLDDVLNTLCEREAKVLKHRYGLCGEKKKTYDAIGKIFGIGRERIRQIELKALRKLRHPSRIELVSKCNTQSLKKAVTGEDN